MYQKAIVLEIKAAYALAMEEGGAILRIRLKEGLAVGDAIYVLPEDLYQEERLSAVIPFPAGGRRRRTSAEKQKKRTRWMRLGGMAAMLALCITLLLPQFAPAAYAVASFDGETSIQVELDQRGRILSASSPDGSMRQETLDTLRGKTLEDAAAALSEWCGSGSILVGYALTDGDGADIPSSHSIQALFPKRPVVFLSGVAGDIHAADTQSVSLGRYLMDRMEAEDLEDVLEDLPPEIIGQLLQSSPSWSRHPDLQEALEDILEDQAGDRETPNESGGAPDESPDESDEDAGDAPSSTDSREEDADPAEEDDKQEQPDGTDDDEDAPERPSGEESHTGADADDDGPEPPSGDETHTGTDADGEEDGPEAPSGDGSSDPERPEDPPEPEEPEGPENSADAKEEPSEQEEDSRNERDDEAESSDEPGTETDDEEQESGSDADSDPDPAD